MSIIKPYTSFEDPNLKHYFASQRRLIQLRKFGLIDEKNRVYPETVYSANIRDVERNEALENSLTQIRAQEKLSKKYAEQQTLWHRKQDEERRKRVQSAQAATSKSTTAVRLPDIDKWTKRDFINNGFHYYPERYRQEVSSSNQWYQLGRPYTSPYIRHSSGKQEKQPSPDPSTNSSLKTASGVPFIKPNQSTTDATTTTSTLFTSSRRSSPSPLSPVPSKTPIDVNIIPFIENLVPLDLVNNGF